MKERHFLKCLMVNFAEIRAKKKKEEAEDKGYISVLKDIGIAVDENTDVPLGDLPVFACLVDMANISQMSPLSRNEGYIQIDFRDGSTNYIKGDFDSLENIINMVAIIHEL